MATLASAPPSNAPLTGVRVLDLSRVLAGPYCAMLLGDLGADVIKVERPVEGDITRAWGPPFAGGESAYYLCCNRNKRSIAINLATPEGVALVKRLAAQSDVVIENFRAGQLDRYGLSWATLQAETPALIGCSISGYGRTGPEKDQGGYDVVIQGTSGFMSITGEPAGVPMKVGVAVVDLLTALFASNAILAALYARRNSAPAERGPIIDMALMDCALAGLCNVAQSALVTGQAPTRYGNEHPNIVPYQLFVGADGEYFLVALGNDAQWPTLCRLIGAPELAENPAYRTNALRVQNRMALIATLDGIFRMKP
ncbi:MAG TPA: CoA transferase, partial [Planctomycetota bacterium]|nr:CoA transferase [Planctomycetota bacterium]